VKNLLNFLVETGKLKGKERRGWQIHRIKNSETTAEHVFHLAILVYVLGKKKKLNLARAIKIALIQDLCEIYAPDLTSYDAILFKNGKKISLEKILKSKPKIGCPTIGQRKQLVKLKYGLEKKALYKLTSKLPADLREEIRFLFEDYKNGLTNEAIFVRQAEYLINVLQAVLYSKKYKQVPHSLWLRRAKAVIDDPALLGVLEEIEKKSLKRK